MHSANRNGIKQHELTFAGLNALVPRVVESGVAGVAGVAALVEPSAAESTTTHFAEVLELIALGACTSLQHFT